MKRAVRLTVGLCVMCACSVGAVLVAPVARADLLPSSTPDAGVPFTDGSVWAVATAPNGITYIGGDFTHIRLDMGSGVALSATSDAIDGRFPRVNGPVSATVADGAGGFYIAGSFSKVGGIYRNKIAHILADGEVDVAFNQYYTDGSVTALALSGSTLYVGGAFTSVGGQFRHSIAALDAVTGAATTWNPNPSLSGDPTFASINAFAVSGSTVYVGGYFDTIGGQTRRGIAALDAVSGLATAWNPNSNLGSWIYALAVSGSTVYVGGYFHQIGGQTRNYIAALNTTSGLAAAWNPNASFIVQALFVSGSTVYVGGLFDSIGGQTRNNVAALNATSGLATAWDPNPGIYGSVDTFAVSGSTVYVGGVFTFIGGQSRNNIAALNATSGLATGWNPDASSQVYALAVSGSTVYVGGEFVSVGSVARNHLAALDAGGAVTAWDPNANGSVYALAVSGSTVYAGGLFTAIGGQTRNHIAALDAASGAATAWDPDANGALWALLVSGSTIYAGGEFTSIGGQSRNNIAALDAASGLATGWDANADDAVWSLAISGSTVYAGGYFTSIGGQNRNSIAALDARTGTATAWDPNATFVDIGDRSQARSGDAGLSSNSSGCAVAALAVSGSTVYVGGLFTSIGGQDRSSLAALSASTGLATAWNPWAAGSYPSVYALAVSGSTVCVGGDYTYIDGRARQSLARFTLSQPQVHSRPHKRHPVPARAGAVLRAHQRSPSVAYHFTGHAGKGISARRHHRRLGQQRRDVR